MKSFFIWLLAILFGAALGFGLNWLTGMNLYLCIGIGIILGNSAGITANIHRSREPIEFDSTLEIEASDADSLIPGEQVKSSVKTNQKTS
jgi:hypothetical protein